MAAPLEGIMIVDFSQFLAGPYASLRLLDMGARVIKVENPDGGDLCRGHYLSDTQIEGDSTLFHAINRGKQSVVLDLKSSEGVEAARKLVAKADIVIQNFRPGVMERLGLSYDEIRKIRPDTIFGSISGYGQTGEWSGLPGQDLLAQARSGIMWLSGNDHQGPVPVGLPIADISAGANLAQGLLGALYQHARTGKGALVETSLLEALLDQQFEFLTTFFNNGFNLPKRMSKGSAHGYLAAPYGVYETKEGYLALAMTPLEKIKSVLEMVGIDELLSKPEAAFQEREQIHAALSECFMTKDADEWERALSKQGIWCAKILNWEDMITTQTVTDLDMLPNMRSSDVDDTKLMRSPIRIDGMRPLATSLGPMLNQDAYTISKEFNLKGIV